MTNRIFMLLSLLMAAYLTITVLNREDADETKTTTADPPAATTTIRSNTANEPVSTETGFVSEYGPRPASIRDIPLDFKFRVDDNGELIVTGDIRDLYDLFLSTIGEEPLATIIARIEEYIRFKLDEPAQQRALDILHDYIAMKKALVDAEQDIAPDITNPESFYQGDARAAIERRQQFRQSYLDPEAYEAFFAQEYRHDITLIEKFEIMSDPTLNAEQRQQRLDEFENNLPEDLKRSRHRMRKLEQMQDQVSHLRQQGASDAEIFAARAARLGPDAAERFRQLDRQRSQWQSRIDSYLAQKRALETNAGLSAQDRNQAIETLRSERFDAREQIRVKVIERQESGKQE